MVKSTLDWQRSSHTVCRPFRVGLAASPLHSLQGSVARSLYVPIIKSSRATGTLFIITRRKRHMAEKQRLYLLQKRGESLVELDPESYDRMLDSPWSTVIRYRNNKPVVKMT